MRQHKREAKFISKFFAYLLLFNILFTAFGEALLEGVILPVLVARPCASIIDYLSPGDNAMIVGNQIRSMYINFSVIKGCDGVESIFLFASAMLAYRIRTLYKIEGLILGLLLLYSFNLARIVGLYYISRDYQSYFNFFHIYIGQSLTVLLACFFFIFWIERCKYKNVSKATP